MSGIKRYLSDNAYKAAEHSESPSESNPFVTLSKAIAMRSDWNENDTTQYDYILNRTHYVDYIPTDYEAEEATFVEAGGYARGSIYGYSSGHSDYPEGFTEALAEGMPVKFVIGNTTYEGIGHRSGSPFYAGNRHIYNNLFPDTGESWCVYSDLLGMAPLHFYIDSSYIGTTQNIVPTTYSEVVHQLPTKFINSDLATKQDVLGFTPENVANKKTTLADNSDTYYPTQKAVKTAVDVKVTGAASSTDNAIARFDGVTGKLVKNSGAYIDDSGNVVISGNATINGTLTTINSETLQVKDKNIAIAKVDTPTDDTADGGGITLLGATNKTITWVKSKLSWVFNQAVEISGNLNVIGNIAVSGTVDGRDVSSDGLKLDTTVVGPASSVANEVPVYDGTTGKALKSGSGVNAVGGNLTATNDMASATKTIGGKVRMEYDTTTDTLKFNFL